MGLLVGGLLLAVNLSQQQQQNKSNASTALSGGEVLLSQNKISKASSSGWWDSPSNAFDGNFSSKWVSDGSDTSAWLQVDLGSSYTLTKVNIYWKDSYASKYAIQVSSNGTSWVSVYTKSNGVGGNETVVLPANTNGRYVRMQAYQGSGLFGYGIYEMQVYGGITPTATPIPPTPTPTINCNLTESCGLSPTPAPTSTVTAAVHGTISGSTTANVGTPLTYTAVASGTRVTGVELDVSPVSIENWTYLGGNNCSFTASCSVTKTWTPTAPGQYYVVFNGYSDANGNNVQNELSEKCTGNPFRLDLGWVDCGSSSRITVTIIDPNAPTVTPIPTTVPTIIPTATSIPTSVPTVTTIPTVIATPTTGSSPTVTTVPTATPIPSGTVLALNLLLHGLGNGGDSANPNGQGNFDLQHPSRTITVQVYNAQNQLVLSQQGTAIFSTTTGRFAGTVSLGTALNSGLYTVKVKTDQFLRSLIPGIVNLTAGQTNTLASAALISGDINNDNKIDILDYNILMGCYADLTPAVSCTVQNTVLADLTDDGHVNAFDYNLFLRELSNLTGQ